LLVIGGHAMQIFNLVVAMSHNKSWIAFGFKIFLAGPKGQQDLKMHQSTLMGKVLNKLI